MPGITLSVVGGPESSRGGAGAAGEDERVGVTAIC